MSADPAPRRQHTQLILTIYGLYGRDEGGAIPVAALIRLLGQFGVPEQGVRSSMSRLKRRGLIESVRHDGVAAYALSSASEDVFREGDLRIYAEQRARDSDPWLLAIFSIPEELRDRRHTLRRELSWMGFGTVSPGVWIAPAHLIEQARTHLSKLDLSQYVTLFAATPLAENTAEDVARWWDLDALSAQYRAFIASHSPLADRWSTVRRGHPRAGRAEAFRDYVPMFTEWRRLPFLDPGLPLRLLPKDWPGAAAHALLDRLQEHLAPLARDYALEVIRSR
ncbi:PaaX family transcriptional regulator C-terminal domain-containing protein [Microbacterium sp. NIBRBAC000506063]|uniref:PaaX family transcriptional regulator n=1 Tax=Microbacterium sp. NIBRBAC000506063 TaxID=2734618 RepID=UPI001BB7A03D|nr:PaaX family transcriptional regulator C-terminal domain-containing protein [Microbacterium sp. NIBRBAC000506063]QTV79105.1 transcriptional regulator [Microbacterium sp. NIBRBAC000506063]